MDAFEFGQIVGEIVGAILVVLLVIYLISKLIGKGKSKAGKSGMVAKPGRQKAVAYSPSRKKEKNSATDKVSVYGKDPERPRQKWV